MDPLMISAASGMKARMESLDMLANNIANTGTTGFKADEEFYTLYQQQLPLIENRWTDFTQGSILPTGNQLDLALSGTGFFALNGPKGTVYTRNGSFKISKNNQLISSDGYTLRNVLDEGRPLVVDPAQPVAIDKAGVVSQGGQQLGQLQIDQPPSATDAIGKLGNSYFALNLSKTTPTVAAPTPVAGTAAAETEVLQGQLEQSNVPVADSTVRLLSLMRQFEMLQKALNVGTEMNKEAIQEVAKAS